MNQSDLDFKEILNQLKELNRKIDQLIENSSKVAVISNDDLLKILGISRRTANQWRADRLIPFYKVGHKVFYQVQDVNEFILNHQAEPNESVRSR